MEILDAAISSVKAIIWKRPVDESENELDGRQTRRRTATSIPKRPLSASTSKQSSMTCKSLSGHYNYYDEENSARYFHPLRSNSPPRSANPLADLPGPDEDVDLQVATATNPGSQPNTTKRLSRSRLLLEDTQTAIQEEERLLGIERQGGLRRYDRATLVPDPAMPTKNRFTPPAPLSHMNTLNNPPSSKVQYMNSHMRRTDPNTRSPQSSIAAISASGIGKQSPHQTSPAAQHSNPNPPYKKPRIGPSPMQGRSVHDAISLDDSQEQNEVQDDDIQSVRTTDSVPAPQQNGIVHPGQAIWTRTTPRRQLAKPADTIESDDDYVQDHGRVNLTSKNSNCIGMKDSEDDDLEFMREATRQRKGEEITLLSPETTSTTIQGNSKTQLLPSRKQQSPSKFHTYRDESQSPDVLQAGPTTSDISLADQNLSSSRRTRPAERLAPSVKDSIVGNVDSTKISRTTKTKSRKVVEKFYRFQLRDVRWQILNDFHPDIVQHVSFIVHPVERTFYFEYGDGILSSFGEDTTQSLTITQPLSRIIMALYGRNSDLVVLRLSTVEDRKAMNGPIGLRLDSHKNAISLIRVIQLFDSHLNVKDIPDDKLERIFQNVDNQDSVYDPATNGAQRQSSQHHATKELVQRMNAQHEKFFNRSNIPDKPETIISGKEREWAATFSSEDDAGVDHPPPRQSPPQNKRTSAVFSSYFNQRQTRAQTRGSANVVEQQVNPPEPPKTKFSSTRGLGEPWKTPLVYPKEGKKRESISFDELWRLDDDEFLNDTLIGFFLRYLQHRTEVERPDSLKKMHFFNSYFFDSLNKGTKGAKNINYEAVARWTRNVDLFKRDFVIVPVNENLHWFVAIICNLPYLKPKKEDEAEEDVDEPPTLTIEDNGDGNDPSQRTTEAQQSFEELSIDDQAHPSSTVTSSQTRSATPKGGRGRKKNFRRSLPRHDTTKPIIITLDSLGVARSVTCSTLRQYIVREAKDKSSLDIDESEIKGMTAKGIPTQGNFSDCGLYMCMYLEQFIHEPYHFVAKLLQREESSIRWPTQIKSDDLRTRMRELILDLHRQQEGEKQQNPIPKLGNILVDMRGPSPEVEVVPESPSRQALLPERRTLEGILTQKQRVSHHFRQKQEEETVTLEDDEDEGFQPEAGEGVISESSQQRHAAMALAQVDAPILIEDDGSPKKGKKKLRGGVGNEDAIENEWRHEAPGDLATMMRLKRKVLDEGRGVMTGKERAGGLLRGIQAFANDVHEDAKNSAEQGHIDGPRAEVNGRQPLRELLLDQQEHDNNVDEEEELEVAELRREIPETQSDHEQQMEDKWEGIKDDHVRQRERDLNSMSRHENEDGIDGDHDGEAETMLV